MWNFVLKPTNCGEIDSAWRAGCDVFVAHPLGPMFWGFLPVGSGPFLAKLFQE